MAEVNYMKRCLEIAQRGKGFTAPNPMVGAMLVYNDRIIAEGWHHKYGEAHAEVDCLNNVTDGDRHLIPDCTMYVTLEPCAHQGKTPPCAHRLVQEGIKHVVIANADPFEQVNGRGVQILRDAGVNVEEGLCDDEGKWVNRRFFCYHRQHRPYIILKWAQSSDGYIAPADRSRAQLTNDHCMRLVHKWRTEESAIIVGATTAINDNPQLTARHWEGKQPLRIVLDRRMTLPTTHAIFNGEATSWIVNETIEKTMGSIRFVKAPFGDSLLEAILEKLYEENILSLIVEGGAQLLNSFIQAGLWDEARVFTAETTLGQGIAGPLLQHGNKAFSTMLGSDSLNVFINTNSHYPYAAGMQL